jgi:DHA2 family multidrug resistance protein
MLMLGFVLLGSTALIPQFTQELLGYTATFAGLAISPGAVLVMVLMPLVGFLQSRMDLRVMIAFGLILGFWGMWKMTGFTTEVDFRHVVWARMIQASGIAFLFKPISTLAYSTLPKEQNTAASGFMNLSRNIGGSIGIAVSTTFLARWTQTHQTYLASHATHYDSPFRHFFDGLVARFLAQGHAQADAVRGATAAVYRIVGEQATMLAYADVFRLMGWGFLISLPLVLLMKKAKGHGGMAH